MSSSWIHAGLLLLDEQRRYPGNRSAAVPGKEFVARIEPHLEK